MKRFFSVLLVLALVLGVCACGKTAQARWQEQLDLGMKYLEELDYEQAILAFTKAIEIDPKQAEAYIARGGAYIASGETADNLAAALADYEAVLSFDEANPDAWLGLADVYIRMGEYDKALEILQKALEKSENSQAVADKIAEMESGSITDSSGNLRRMNGYDENGMLAWYHQYTYNASGQMASVTSYDAAGGQTGHVDQAYDGEGRCLVSYTYYTYTGQVMRLEHVYESDGSIKSLYYDPTGELDSYEIFRMDEKGRNIRTEAYDINGELTAYYLYVYDDTDDWTRMDWYDSEGNPMGSTEQIYNSSGQCTERLYYDSLGSLTDREVYFYDEAGQCTGREIYDGDGNLIRSTQND